MVTHGENGDKCRGRKSCRWKTSRHIPSWREVEGGGSADTSPCGGSEKCMQFQMHGFTEEPIDALRQYGERRLQFALGRFHGRIRRVSMQLFGRGGSVAGVEPECQVSVYLIPSGHIVTLGMGDDLYAAIDWAAERSGRAVGRKLEID